jgi:ABC-2 type transport system ATP-binding protein
MIEVRELRKTYGDHPALDGFNLQVDAGELFGLVGPNGAGKSTLIKVLATLLTPTEGIARISGIDVQYERDEVKQIVGYMPDQPGLYQDMRLREFLQFFADAFRIPQSEQSAAIDSALSIAGLTGRSQQFVEELSFGLKQRLFLAKTLLHKPKVLLLDEPATGLDPIARLDLRELLKRLNAAGVTILISSHILSDLEDICTRVALISNGKNVTDADGHAVIDLARPTITRVCEIDVLGSAVTAVPIIQRTTGAKLIRTNGPRLTVELTGGATAAAALLRELVTSGVDVVHFDYRSVSLEEMYQKAFGAEKS